jgi:hypothetical protein
MDETPIVWSERTRGGALLLIFLVAVLARLWLLGALGADRKWQRFYATEYLARAVCAAKGEALDNGYVLYFQALTGLQSLQQPHVDFGPLPARPSLADVRRVALNADYLPYRLAVPYVLLVGALFRLAGAVDVSLVRSVQAGVDSLGCLLVYGILARARAHGALLGAAIYALWPPAVWFCLMIAPDALIPVVTLALAYCGVRAQVGLRGDAWRWLAMAGVCLGTLLRLRSDTALVLPLLALYLWFRRDEPARRRALMVLVLVASCSAVGWLFQRAVAKDMRAQPILGVTLYNALAEWPATFRGFRQWRDGFYLQEAKAKDAAYLRAGDRPYRAIRGVFLAADVDDVQATVYVRDIVLGRPVLYADWLASRFFAYLPGHPPIASTAAAFADLNLRYRYSPLYQGLKYVDRAFFGLVLLGVWQARRNRALMSLLCIYFAVLIAHVLTAVGEFYFQDEAEIAWLDSRYLLGMAILWPVFLAVGLDYARQRLDAGRRGGRAGYDPALAPCPSAPAS